LRRKAGACFKLTLESYLLDMMAVAEASSGYHKAVRLGSGTLFSSIVEGAWMRRRA